MGLEDVTTNLISFMRSYITDPTGDARTWIFPTMPKVTANFPEITLANIGSSSKEIGLGNTGQRYVYIFEVEVWVKRDNQVSISTPIPGSNPPAVTKTVYAGRRLLERISDSTTNAFLNNKEYLFNTYNIIDVELYNHFTLPFDEEIDCFRKSIMLRVTADRT